MRRGGVDYRNCPILREEAEPLRTGHRRQISAKKKWFKTPLVKKKDEANQTKKKSKRREMRGRIRMKKDEGDDSQRKIK